MNPEITEVAEATETTGTAQNTGLSAEHLAQIESRGILPEWAAANCISCDIPKASVMLAYEAKSAGIMLVSDEYGQWQFRPDEPWISKTGDLPKYRTPYHEYDLFLAKHPSIDGYWRDLEALKARCFAIDGKPYLVLTEGGFKAIIGCQNDIPTVAVVGVTMALTPKSKGEPDLIPGLKRLAEAGFNFIIGFDSDIKPETIKNVGAAEKRMTKYLEAYKCEVLSVTGHWKSEDGKGMDDFIQNKGIEEFRAILEKAKTSEGKKTAKPPSPRQIAHQLAEDYRAIWQFDNEQKTWRIWAEKTWEKLEIASFASLIKSTIDARGVDYKGFSYIADTIKLVECDLRQNHWQKWDRKRFINFKNGILDGDTGELLEHCPGSGFTSALPFEYKPLKGKITNVLQALEENCPNIHRWMNLAMKGNVKKIAKLLAIVNGCLRFSFHGWQQFVHLIGVPGSGKGTFARLLEKVVGKENSQPCALENLKDGSTIASIIDKQLVVFSDERKPVGVDTILRLTGGDTINYREIFTPAAKASFYGLLLICSNDPIFMGNTTGLERRLCLVAFDNPIPKALRNPDIEASFDDEIAALIAIALAMPSTEVAQSIKGIGDAEIADFKITEWEMKVRMDSLAAFFEMNLIVEDGAKIQAGDLYKNYKDFCEEIKKPAMSLTTFSPGLEKLCTELHQPATRDKSGRHVTFLGLRLRKDEDAHPTYSQKLTALAGLDAGVAGLSAGLSAGLATIPCKGLQDLQDLSLNTFENSQILKTEPDTESSEVQGKTEKTEKTEKTNIKEVSPSSPASPANPLQDKALSPASQVLHSPASPAIGDALNDSELELIQFIRACDDTEEAIDIQKILTDCCDRNEADRAKIWAALNSEEQSKYKSLLNPPQSVPEPIAPPTVAAPTVETTPEPTVAAPPPVEATPEPIALPTATAPKKRKEFKLGDRVIVAATISGNKAYRSAVGEVVRVSDDERGEQVCKVKLDKRVRSSDSYECPASQLMPEPISPAWQELPKKP